MRLPLPPRQLWCRVVGGAALLTLSGPAPAAAQARSAAIKVSASVRSVTEADVLSAHAVVASPETPSPDRVPASGAWRIRWGRTPSVGIRVDGAAAVTICRESTDAVEQCEPYGAPRLETTGDGTSPQLMLRMGESRSVVRVTLAFIDL